MSTQPPRRRRPDAGNPNPFGGGWLPTLAMGLGVIVAGLGIGALVAVLLQRSSGKPAVVPQPVAAVTSTAAPSAPPGRAPVAIATIAPSPTPRAAPPTTAPTTFEPTAAPSPGPSPTSIPSPPAARSATARPAAPRAVAVATAVVATPAPVRVAAASPSPTPSPPAPPVPSVAAGTPAPPAAASNATSAYDEHASAVVRRYLEALIRGDQKTAYDALGAGGGTLSEQAFLDPSAQIVSLKVTRIDASNASVGCEIASAKGHYYATYHVTAATNGPYIAEHDYIKV